MQVIQPVRTCETCQKQFQQLKTLYGMYQACPSDPGATGVFQASLKEYREHHSTNHKVEDYGK